MCGIKWGRDGLELFLLNDEIMMNSERIIRMMAGFFILVSLLLGAPASPLYHSSYWLWFTVFVGFNLFQSGFTRFCPAETLLGKLGIGKTDDQPVRVIH